jgi:hypothetical protein
MRRRQFLTILAATAFVPIRTCVTPKRRILIFEDDPCCVMIFPKHRDAP